MENKGTVEVVIVSALLAIVVAITSGCEYQTAVRWIGKTQVDNRTYSKPVTAGGGRTIKVKHVDPEDQY